METNLVFFDDIPIEHNLLREQNLMLKKFVTDKVIYLPCIYLEGI